MEVVKGQVYKHFKGNIYKVLLIACDCEDLEKVVVYQDINNEDKIWVRKYSDFISKVDRVKYPDILQEYRFELVDND